MIEPKVENPAYEPPLFPGQLWVWKQILDKRSDEIWPLVVVTEEARHMPTTHIVLMRPGDALLMVKPDDDGPYETPTFDPNTFSMQPLLRRYHVVLVRNTLCWVRHDWLIPGAELVKDVV